MKKTLALLIAITTIFTLASCAGAGKTPDKTDYNGEASNPETMEETLAQTEPETTVEETKAEATENVNNDIDTQNVFYNPNNNYYDVDALSIKPRTVYWDNGELVAECFVINGFSHNVFNINVKSITFSTPSGEIASGSGFGVLENVTLAPYTNVLWVFRFSGDAVINYGADLSTLTCSASVSNSF